MDALEGRKHFELGYVAIEDRFIWDVYVPVSVPGLAPSSAGHSLLLQLDFIPDTTALV